MEFSDSSLNYMKATSSSHTKKENSPGETELEDTFSVSSSTVGSPINGQYAPRVKYGIHYRTNNKKTPKSLGNAKSLRRRAKSRILQPIEMPDNTSASCRESLVDASEASTHYLKSTSCSQGMKMNSRSSTDGSCSTFLGSKLPSSRRRAFKTMSRTSSIKNVGILIKKTCFKPRRPLFDDTVSEDLAVDRATYSSTVKDSKFPQPVEISFGETQSGKNSGMKVCRYHRCSLHGHCREDHDSVSPPKRFLHKKRQPSIKPKNEVVKSGQCSCETKDHHGKMKNHEKSQMVSITKSSVQEGEMVKGMDLYLPFNDEQNSEAHVEGYGGIQEFDFLEIAFGETSFPERSYEENLIIMRKYSPQDQQIGYCLKCSGNITEQSLSTPRGSDHATNSNLDKDNNYVILPNRDADVLDTHPLAHFENSRELKIHVEDHASFITGECENGTSSNDFPETPVVFDEGIKDRSVSSSLSDSPTLSDNNSEVEGELTTVSSITENFITSEVVQIPVSENDASASEGNKLQFSKPRHMSMWHLIHQHMASELATEAVNKPFPSAEDQDFVDDKTSFLLKESLVASPDFSDSNIGAENGSETQEIEIRKLFAIKLVREAIEKILLPEVQDDLSVTSENISPKEDAEKKQNEDCTEESCGDPCADKGKGCVPSTPEEMGPIAEDSFSMKVVKAGESAIRKSDKKAPKHWSNLKKWILLQRFIRELEKVRKFNPRKPRQLPLSPDLEAEKVNLRPLALDEKKRGEGWMLDYALRQAVNELAPTQKRKVALLVKAFETVVPPPEDNQSLRRRDKNVAPVEGKGTLLGNDKVSGLVTARQERSATLIEKYSNLLTSNQNVSKSECGDSDPSVATKSLIIDDMGKSIVTEKVILAEPDVKIPREENTSEHKDTNGDVDDQVNRKDHINMWHMIYQHVLCVIAEKMGSQLLDGSDDGGDKSPGTSKENRVSNNPGSGFTKSDALKLVKEAVDEILLPDTQGNTSDALSVSTEKEISEENIREAGEEEKSKPENWKKLKKQLLLKKSIKALEKARKRTQAHELLTQEPDSGPGRIDLKRQIMDEKKKAEQWMLDYAVQHIVTKLNPARKRRVYMLVEAFEAVVPFPEI
ncbi:uncharacterized protein LOC142552067 [Primulina tabacum]|uniref:uncharacterized protein LOC142552067 n=1 Tax=Primulina tabacum TaxID=48773 RepID=UPI003F594A1F